MKNFILGFAIVAMAVATSAFTNSNAKTENLHYFRNEGLTKSSPQWKYIGQIEPSPLDCSLNDENYCYGASEMGPDSSGQPTGTVAAVKDGDYTP